MARVISRVLSPFLGGCDHFSRPAVARGLKRPTRLTPAGRAVALLRGPETVWPCTRWGLPCLGCHQSSGALLPHLFTLTVRRFSGLWIGGIFSVALSLRRLAFALARVGVTHHRVLSCSDFPLPGHEAQAAAASPRRDYCSGGERGGVGND